MYSSATEVSFATTSSKCDRPIYSTPQRKARYHDDSRPRLRQVKEAALKYLGMSSSVEVRSLLKELGIRLDLRMTSAWCAIAWELMPHLLRLLEQKKLVAGAIVNIINCPANIYSLSPFRIVSIHNDVAQLEYLATLYPLDRLELAS